MNFRHNAILIGSKQTRLLCKGSHGPVVFGPTKSGELWHVAPYLKFCSWVVNWGCFPVSKWLHPACRVGSFIFTDLISNSRSHYRQGLLWHLRAAVCDWEEGHFLFTLQSWLYLCLWFPPAAWPGRFHLLSPNSFLPSQIVSGRNPTQINLSPKNRGHAFQANQIWKSSSLGDNSVWNLTSYHQGLISSISRFHFLLCWLYLSRIFPHWDMMTKEYLFFPTVSTKKQNWVPLVWVGPKSIFQASSAPMTMAWEWGCGDLQGKSELCY